MNQSGLPTRGKTAEISWRERSTWKRLELSRSGVVCIYCSRQMEYSWLSVKFMLKSSYEPP
jgi:hypothetical protein